MADFPTEVAVEIAQAHTEWRETGSEDARNRLFTILDSWVRKQAHFMLLRKFGGTREVVNTNTFAQDVLTKLLTSLHRIEYRSLPELLSYILAALRSYLIDLARNQKGHEISLSGVNFSELAASSGVELDHTWRSNAVSIVDGDFSRLIQMLNILGRIEQVHPLHGVVFQLRVLAGFERPEIAEHLGLPEKEVDGMLRHARTKFRNDWNKIANQAAS